MKNREKYLARQRRYNTSEKGLERYRRYWWKRSTDPTPFLCEDGMPHPRLTKGAMFSLQETWRKDKARRRKRIERPEERLVQLDRGGLGVNAALDLSARRTYTRLDTLMPPRGQNLRGRDTKGVISRAPQA